MRRAMNKERLKKWKTEQLSNRVLYGWTALTALVFVLFWTVGYDLPFPEDPNFNAPLFTDVLLLLMVLSFIAATVIAVATIVRTARIRSKGEQVVNGIPVKRISYSIAIGLLAIFLLTFAFGSTSPMKINGVNFDEALWLRLTDMFVNTMLLMLVIAVGTVIYGATRYIRKR